MVHQHLHHHIQQRRQQHRRGPYDPSSSGSGNSQGFHHHHRSHHAPTFFPPPGHGHAHQVPHTPSPRQEVESVCLDLLRRFHHASEVYPRRLSSSYLARSGAAATEDPLMVTTRLLSDAQGRLRLFLSSLDPMGWLHERDRRGLYSAHVCSAAILKSASCVDVAALPDAYPLPYGEYLGEVEVLQLIQAHDLYNELKALVSGVQALAGAKELPVMLLVMMVAYFRPTRTTISPAAVVKMHDYYLHKLQVRNI